MDEQRDYVSLNAFLDSISLGMLATSPKATEAGRAILSASNDEKVAILRQAVARIASNQDHPIFASGRLASMSRLCRALVRTKLRYEKDDIEGLTRDLAIGACNIFSLVHLPVKAILTDIQGFVYLNGVTEKMRHELDTARKGLLNGGVAATLRESVSVIDALIGPAEPPSAELDQGCSMPVRSEDDEITARKLVNVYADYEPLVRNVTSVGYLFDWHKQSSEYAKIFASSNHVKVAALIYSLNLFQCNNETHSERSSGTRSLVVELLDSPLLYTSEDLIRILDLLNSNTSRAYGIVTGDTSSWSIVRGHIAEHGLSESLQAGLERCRSIYARSPEYPGLFPLAHQMNELMGLIRPGLPEPGEEWAETAVREIEMMDITVRQAFEAILSHSLEIGDGKPSKKWLQVSKVRAEAVEPRLLATTFGHWIEILAQQDFLVSERNSQALKGIALHIASLPEHTAINSLSRLVNVCYEKIPGAGPRSKRAGNACFTALRIIGTETAISVLRELQDSVPYTSAKTSIGNELKSVGIDTGWRSKGRSMWRAEYEMYIKQFQREP